VVGVLAVVATCIAVAGVAMAGLATYVARRQSSPAGVSLAVLLLAVAWWGLAYAFELSTTDLVARGRWGDWKYVGVSLVPPAWLVFVLQYTGRAHRVTRRLLTVLAVEPILVLTLLAVPVTHDLVRFYPESAEGQELPVVGTGPLFWVHLVYANVVVLTATVVFVVTMTRISRLYWRLAAALVAAAMLPWVANLLHNLEIGPFWRMDLTPFAFVVTGAVLVWGLYRERLVRLTPVARSMVMESMADAVIVLDAFARVVDANPAAARLFGRSRADLTGRSLSALVPQLSWRGSARDWDGPSETQVEVAFDADSGPRYYDARRQPLLDRVGALAGELVVLRDVTERKTTETRLQELLSERTRVATALQASLLPAELPPIPGVDVASVYEPAGDGSEIGGDFLDVFPLGAEGWGVVLGDVSGKGAEAAAVTALVRYTLRTLAVGQRPPHDVLRDLNSALLREGTDERYCTLVYGHATATDEGMRLRLCLAGHHPPLLLRPDGRVEAVGRLGTALGLVPDPELAETAVDLSPGDLLCLFTDGLVEARRDQELFESDRATAVLARCAQDSASEALVALSSAVRAFSGAALTDDLALLALRVRQPAGVVKVDA